MSFEVDLATTERLAERIPPGVVLVAESGIFTNDDVRRLERCGAEILPFVSFEPPFSVYMAHTRGQSAAMGTNRASHGERNGTRPESLDIRFRSGLTKRKTGIRPVPYCKSSK